MTPAKLAAAAAAASLQPSERPTMTAQIIILAKWNNIQIETISQVLPHLFALDKITVDIVPTSYNILSNYFY